MEPSSTFTSIGYHCHQDKGGQGLEKKCRHPRQLGRLGGETLAALVGLLNPSLFHRSGWRSIHSLRSRLASAAPVMPLAPPR